MQETPHPSKMTPPREINRVFTISISFAGLQLQMAKMIMIFNRIINFILKLHNCKLCAYSKNKMHVSVTNRN